MIGFHRFFQQELVTMPPSIERGRDLHRRAFWGPLYATVGCFTRAFQEAAWYFYKNNLRRLFSGGTRYHIIFDPDWN